ncbi:hypothetical protein BaRGS_00000103 [Batillaria attramentaria]|uniref:Uncharacterized protein n=1 Tax=Batillaria attramentaria TaxID=370345 RepID=A0ABD0MAD6_9CAEN
MHSAPERSSKISRVHHAFSAGKILKNLTGTPCIHRRKDPQKSHGYTMHSAKRSSKISRVQHTFSKKILKNLTGTPWPERSSNISRVHHAFSVKNQSAKGSVLKKRRGTPCIQRKDPQKSQAFTMHSLSEKILKNLTGAHCIQRPGNAQNYALKTGTPKNSNNTHTNIQEQIHKPACFLDPHQQMIDTVRLHEQLECIQRTARRSRSGKNYTPTATLGSPSRSN